MKVSGLILLDFDGTLVTFGHDMGYIRRALTDELEDLDQGLELPEGYLLEGFEQVERRSLELGATPAEAARVKDRLERLLVQLEAEGATRCRLVEGTAEVLAWARGKGYRLAIVTRGHTSYVLPLLQHYRLDPLIDAIVTREDDIPAKPHPAGARLAARRAGLDLDRLEHRFYLAGDHIMDMQMADAAGAIGIGVLTGLSGAAELREAGAAHILDSLAQLPQVIA